MMNNVLEYKGYFTRIESDAASCTLRGKIEGIRDLVDFESSSAENIQIEFHNAVDDYLQFCEEVGKTPERSYRGSFNVRIKPQLHKRLYERSLQEDASMNSVVEEAIAAYLKDEHPKDEKNAGDDPSDQIL